MTQMDKTISNLSHFEGQEITLKGWENLVSHFKRWHRVSSMCCRKRRS